MTLSLEDGPPGVVCVCLCERDGTSRADIRDQSARAYYLSHSLDPENYARAETTVEELIQAIDANPATIQVRPFVS